MRTIKLFALAALMTPLAVAADAQEHPFYGRVGMLATQGDWRAWNAGSVQGQAFELGYTAPADGDFITYGLWAGHVRSVGDKRQDLGTSLTLSAWRAGADLVFLTPVEGLRAYAGLNLNCWNGKWNQDNATLGTKGEFSDSKGKLGLRLGVEYRITKEWGATLDYSAAEYRSSQRFSKYPVQGLNPVNPSWITLSVQYRFSYGK